MLAAFPVATFVLTFSPVPLTLKGKLRDGSVGFFMYFQTGVLTRNFRVASGIKSTRKVFCQATELLVLIDHEFAENSTSPLFAFLCCPSHMGILLSFGEAAYRGVLGHTWVRKTQVKIVRKR